MSLGSDANSKRNEVTADTRVAFGDDLSNPQSKQTVPDPQLS